MMRFTLTRSLRRLKTTNLRPTAPSMGTTSYGRYTQEDRQGALKERRAEEAAAYADEGRPQRGRTVAAQLGTDAGTKRATRMAASNYGCTDRGGTNPWTTQHSNQGRNGERDEYADRAEDMDFFHTDGSSAQSRSGRFQMRGDGQMRGGDGQMRGGDGQMRGGDGGRSRGKFGTYDDATSRFDSEGGRSAMSHFEEDSCGHTAHSKGRSNTSRGGSWDQDSGSISSGGRSGGSQMGRSSFQNLRQNDGTGGYGYDDNLSSNRDWDGSSHHYDTSRDGSWGEEGATPRNVSPRGGARDSGGSPRPMKGYSDMSGAGSGRTDRDAMYFDETPEARAMTGHSNPSSQSQRGFGTAAGGAAAGDEQMTSSRTWSGGGHDRDRTPAKQRGLEGSMGRQQERFQGAEGREGSDVANDDVWSDATNRWAGVRGGGTDGGYRQQRGGSDGMRGSSSGSSSYGGGSGRPYRDLSHLEGDYRHEQSGGMTGGNRSMGDRHEHSGGMTGRDRSVGDWMGVDRTMGDNMGGERIMGERIGGDRSMEDRMGDRSKSMARSFESMGRTFDRSGSDRFSTAERSAYFDRTMGNGSSSAERSSMMRAAAGVEDNTTPPVSSSSQVARGGFNYTRGEDEYGEHYGDQSDSSSRGGQQQQSRGGQQQQYSRGQQQQHSAGQQQQYSGRFDASRQGGERRDVEREGYGQRDDRDISASRNTRHENQFDPRDARDYTGSQRNMSAERDHGVCRDESRSGGAMHGVWERHDDGKWSRDHESKQSLASRAKSAASNAAATIKQKATDAADAFSETMHEAKDATSRATDNVKGAAAAAGDKIAETAAAAGEKIMGGTKSGADKSDDALKKTKDSKTEKTILGDPTKLRGADDLNWVRAEDGSGWWGTSKDGHERRFYRFEESGERTTEESRQWARTPDGSGSFFRSVFRQYSGPKEGENATKSG